MTTSQPADPLREALDAHEYEEPPHEEGYFRDSAYCLCDQWQWDAPGPWEHSYHAEAFGDWHDHRDAAVRTALGDHATLGLAWASVEAALPEGWRVGEIKHTGYRGDSERWLVMAWEFGDDPDYRTFKSAFGPTPEAALLALHAALTEEKP